MNKMVINIILINLSIIFLFNIYFFNYKQKTDFFVTTLTTKFMKFLNYNIDSQPFKNVGILNIYNISFRTTYILKYFVFS